MIATTTINIPFIAFVEASDLEAKKGFSSLSSLCFSQKFVCSRFLCQQSFSTWSNLLQQVHWGLPLCQHFSALWLVFLQTLQKRLEFFHLFLQPSWKNHHDPASFLACDFSSDDFLRNFRILIYFRLESLLFGLIFMKKSSLLVWTKWSN